MTPRRIEFRIAVLRRDWTMERAARELNISYNHLTLVLDGKRKGSARLERAIARFIRGK